MSPDETCCFVPFDKLINVSAKAEKESHKQYNSPHHGCHLGQWKARITK